MKMNLYIIALVLILPCLFISKAQSQDLDSLSYSVGLIAAHNLKSEGFEGLDAATVAQAVKDFLNSKDAQGSEVKINKDVAYNLYTNELKNLKIKAKEMNKTAGEEFLAKNATKEGVVTTASGLQYEVMVQGDGAMPTATDKVKTHYHGTLIDGTVFDSSVDRGQPISFPLGNVIQAWQEALPLMKVGSKYRIFSPYNLAYGERGAGGAIKPFSALIFEIELLGIE